MQLTLTQKRWTMKVRRVVLEGGIVVLFGGGGGAGAACRESQAT